RTSPATCAAREGRWSGVRGDSQIIAGETSSLEGGRYSVAQVGRQPQRGTQVRIGFSLVLSEKTLRPWSSKPRSPTSTPAFCRRLPSRKVTPSEYICTVPVPEADEPKLAEA